MEFAIVLIIKKRQCDDNQDYPQQKTFNNQINAKEIEMPQTPKYFEDLKVPSGFKTSYTLTERIDFVALIVFALCYFIFNCIYFVHYMHE